ncbi:MAG: hypothetical protein PHV35_00985 [Mariniphaga sp.]|nr:hypothetical protein [Mariniphaga sp.]
MNKDMFDNVIVLEKFTAEKYTKAEIRELFNGRALDSRHDRRIRYLIRNGKIQISEKR